MLNNQSTKHKYWIEKIKFGRTSRTRTKSPDQEKPGQARAPDAERIPGLPVAQRTKIRRVARAVKVRSIFESELGRKFALGGGGVKCLTVTSEEFPPEPQWAGSSLLKSNLPNLQRLIFGIVRKRGRECNAIQEKSAELVVHPFWVPKLYLETSILVRE